MSDAMTKEENPDTTLTENEVINWLRENPAFLQDNPHILDVVPLPREKKGKGVTDFQYYMMKRLKDDRDEVIQSTREIVETSRANMNNLSRIQNAILMILEARDFDDFLKTITMDIASILDVDIISLAVETNGDVIPHIDLQGVKALPAGSINKLMGDKGILLESSVTGLTDLYGGGAPLVKSHALMRLSIVSDAAPALIAFGSRNPQLFEEGQATDLLAFLGRVIERSFRLWLMHQ